MANSYCEQQQPLLILLDKRSQKSSVTKKPKPRKRKASESSSSDHSISPEPVAPSNPTLHNPDIPCAAEKKCKKPQSANVVWVRFQMIVSAFFHLTESKGLTCRSPVTIVKNGIMSTVSIAIRKLRKMKTFSFTAAVNKLN